MFSFNFKGFKGLSLKDLGTEKELTKKFEERKAVHKYSVLMSKLIKDNEFIMANEVNIPDFMGGDTPEKRAERQIREIYNLGIDNFNRAYEIAWNEIAEMMD